VFSHILDGVHPEFLKAVVQASLQATNDIKEARKASFVVVTASAAAQNGAQIESEIENTLMDIVDQCSQRLQNRVHLCYPCHWNWKGGIFILQDVSIGLVTDPRNHWLVLLFVCAHLTS
jgi:hypothetical protein